MQSIVIKRDIDHKIFLALLRYKGDVFSVASELNVPVEYVERLYKKLKKRQQRDTSYWISTNIMQTLLEGYQQRTAWLMNYLKVLEGKEQIPVSSCHHEPIIQKDSDILCSACNQPCSVVLMPRDRTYKLFLKILEQLRKEDSALVKFAESMGFVGQPSEPIVKQNILVVNNKSATIDEEVDQIATKLSPQDREKARKELEKQLRKSLGAVDFDSNEK